MIADVRAEVEDAARRLRTNLPDLARLEAGLDQRFDKIADDVVHGRPEADVLGASRPSGGSVDRRVDQLRVRAERAARSRLGPPVRRLERRSAAALRSLTETAATRVEVALDHGARLVARSPGAARLVRASIPGALGKAPGAGFSSVPEGALRSWVLDQVAPRGTEGAVVHAECGDGSVVEELLGSGVDARGVDPGLSERSRGTNPRLVAGGTLEYLGAAPASSLGGLLLTGGVNRLRPGAARALVQLAASRLSPGATVVVVTLRPESVVATDPVAADLSGARPLHAVTWCHLFSRYGLEAVEVNEGADCKDGLVAVAARRPDPGEALV